MTKTFGVCGVIASGKSTLVKYMQECLGDCELVNVDLLGHKVYELNVGNVIQELENEFGSDIIMIVDDKKTVNRRALGPIVFGNKEKMDKLSSIVWPHIKTLVLEAKEAHKDVKFIIFEAPILVEAGWSNLFDEIWCFSCPPDIACDRLMKRNNLTQEDAMKRINSQLPNHEREKYAHVIIDTNGDVQSCQDQIKSHLCK